MKSFALAITLISTGIVASARAEPFTQATLTIRPGTASCGGPLLSPPPLAPFAGALYRDTGCAAPVGDDCGLDTCEARARRAFAAFGRATIVCEIRQARAVFHDGGTSNTITDAAERCKQAAKTKLEGRLAGLACPAEVLNGAAAYENAMLSGADSFDTMNGDVYCDAAAGALRIDPTGPVNGFVPGERSRMGRAIMRCGRATWKNISRLIFRLAECRVAAASALASGNPADEMACQTAAQAKYDRTAARGLCPSCLDGPAQARLRELVVARARHSSGLLYPCSAGGSPFSKIADLGLGCLYLPFAAGVPVPEGATKTVAVTSLSGTTLTFAGADAPSPLECTKGSGPGKHCLTTGNAGCATDADCGNVPGACAFDVNCFFVQPIPIVNGGLSICLVDVIETEETGTIDVMSGTVSVMEHHASRAYLTRDAASPCPRCVDGTCTAGKNVGGSCTAVGSAGTSIECLPGDDRFITAPQLHEVFSTGASELDDYGGGFCPSQSDAGAFGAPEGVRITAAGSPAGSLADGQPHPVVLASTFCISSTGNSVLDSVVSLPGPGMVSGPAVIQLR